MKPTNVEEVSFVTKQKYMWTKERNIILYF